MELPTEISINIRQQEVILRGDGTVFIPDQRALLVADLHLGKDASFRAGGIPVPAGINAATLMALAKSIESTHPETLYLLGDLIHDRDSMSDDLIEDFAFWRAKHRDLLVTLIRGNHDRHVKQFPESWDLKVVREIDIEPFQLRHEVSEASLAASDLVQFGGHWHPVITTGRGADKMRLRCFVVEPRQVTLPAFGGFKGGMNQTRAKARSFYAICEGKIWAC